MQLARFCPVTLHAGCTWLVPKLASVTRQASKIPPFFVAFCVTPLASNASELVSSLYFASRKHVKNISLTFCQV